MSNGKRELIMFSELRKRAQKKGHAPGTPIFTGEVKTDKPIITVINYSKESFNEIVGDHLEKCMAAVKEEGVNWVNVEGLHDVEMITHLGQYFKIHPLTIEDILNVEHRPKVEEFDNYLFVTLKILLYDPKNSTFVINQLSIILGKNFVLTFQESDTKLFDNIRDRLKNIKNHSLREHGSDYLMYRLLDAVIDDYFIVLEALGDQIEKIEENIISGPMGRASHMNSNAIYHLKRQALLLRKAIWPMREVIGQITHVEDKLITDFTRLYLRDVYDHTVQAIDTIETFRDMLASMLDMYLSILTNRMNEIMKTLTIIATIFIPLTWLASLYGMNFPYMPGLYWRYGYPMTLLAMGIMAVAMIIYFKRRKWI